MSRALALILADWLASRATGLPPDRFAATVVDGCLDDLTARLGWRSAPTAAEIAEAMAEAARVNAGGFAAQFAYLIGRSDDPGGQADEILSRVELDEARKAAGV